MRMAEGHGGNAQTLRDYWSGHGHAGPSHGAERDAIGWGTPGDFMRCVAQVTEHGHMTDEQAKGYCNLRHHEALGYYPATHARMEGKMAASEDDEVTLIHVEGEGDKDHDGDGLFDADGDGDGAVATLVRRKKKKTNKAAGGSAESRVPPGKTTGGQFTVGGDGPSTAPKKPNPYAHGKKKTGPGSQRGRGGKSGAGKPKGKAAIRQKIAQLRHRLGSLQAEEKSLQAKLPHQQSSGTRSSTTSSAARSSTASSSPSSPSSRSGKPGSSKPQSSVQQQLAQVRAQIKQIKAQIAAQEAQLSATKSVRNPRDNPTGRFRTFEGESKEASHAFREGRIPDAIDLLGSARALATEPGHRTVLDQMQRSLARVQHHVVPEVTKSFIRGDSIAHRDKTGFHEGSAGDGHVYLRTRDGVRYRVPKDEVRAASDTENEDLYRQESDPGLPEPEDPKEAKKGLAGGAGSDLASKYRFRHGWIPLDGAGEKPRKGDTVHAEHEDGTKVTGIHDGTMGGRINIMTPQGGVATVPKNSVRIATAEENDQHNAELRAEYKRPMDPQRARASVGV